MKSKGIKLDATLDLRLSTADLEAFRRRAAADGIPLSTWLRIAGQEKLEAQERKERWQRERAAMDMVRENLANWDLSGHAKRKSAKIAETVAASLIRQDKGERK